MMPSSKTVLSSCKQLDDAKQLDGARSLHITKPFPNSGEPDVQIISAYKLQNSL